MKAGQEEWSLNVSLKKSKQSTYVYKLKVDLCTEKDTTYLQGFIFIANQCSNAKDISERVENQVLLHCRNTNRYVFLKMKKWMVQTYCV